ncbi:MAG: potassium channel protein [Chitinophagaceae bacterium]|nr:potassium channel protein [Chitinophagaceae bacterium]
MSGKLTRWLLFKRFASPVLILVALSVIGTVGYVYIDGYSWLNALYMTIITVGTVGFGEIQPLSDAGKLFTIFLIIASIGTVAYYITMVTRLLLDGEWRRQYRLFRQSKKLQRMENHVIVCGHGRNGRQACDVLRKNGIPFIVVEQRQHLVGEAEEDAELIIPGDATKDEVLVEAGIMRARALISALPNDADNLFVVLTARQLCPDLVIISRASDDHSIKKLKIAGATNVIMPDKLGGAHMASLVMIPDVQEFLSMLSTSYNDRFQVAELEVREAVNLGELNLWQRTGCNVIGVKQTDGKYRRNPQPDYIAMKGERLIVMGSREVIDKARQLL